MLTLLRRFCIVSIAIFLFACSPDTGSRGDAGSVASGETKVTTAVPLDNREIAELNGRFQSRLDGLCAEYGFPGATAAYSLPGGYVAGFATGLADKENAVVMQPHMMMLSASIGKSYVAAIMCQLVDEGLLTFSDPLSKWLGNREWFEGLPNASEITLAHLLSHSAGLPDHVYSPEFANAAREAKEASEKQGETLADLYLSPEELIFFILDKDPLFPVGHGYAYTDTGYLLIGLVIEEVTGRDYYDLVNDRLLAPLGLFETLPADRRDLPNLSQGYSASDNSFGLPPLAVKDGLMTHNPAIEWTGGGLVSTAGDLARWFFALFTTEIAGSDYASRVKEIARTNDVEHEYPKQGYGLGIQIKDTTRGQSFEHSGWTPSYLSFVVFYPNTGVAVSVMVNTDDETIMKDGVLTAVRTGLDEVVHQSVGSQ